MCGQAKVKRRYKDCLEGKQHFKETFEYPFEERCDDPNAGTAQCPSIKPSTKMVFGSTPVNASCPDCAFERAQQRSAAT